MTNNTLAVINGEKIKSLIYEIRGIQVMLDSDVANLFEYETKNLNRSVKNNIERFPESYCFRLSEEEYNSLRCKNFTLNNLGTGQHRKYLPYVFTEYGITMLAGILKNKKAVEVSIRIVNTFIEMRKFISNNKDIFNRLTTVEYRLLEYDKKFDVILDELQKSNIIKEKIFYEGQIYDAYSLLVNIIKTANREIIIVDNYIDTTMLDVLTKKKVNIKVSIITNTNCKLSSLDISKFNEQYPKLKVIYSSKYHDRFIIIDKIVYHCGASLKDLGKKCFAITKMEDSSIIEKIIKSEELG